MSIKWVQHWCDKVGTWGRGLGTTEARSGSTAMLQAWRPAKAASSDGRSPTQATLLVTPKGEVWQCLRRAQLARQRDGNMAAAGQGLDNSWAAGWQQAMCMRTGSMSQR